MAKWVPRNQRPVAITVSSVSSMASKNRKLDDTELTTFNNEEPNQRPSDQINRGSFGGVSITRAIDRAPTDTLPNQDSDASTGQSNTHVACEASDRGGVSKTKAVNQVTFDAPPNQDLDASTAEPSNHSMVEASNGGGSSDEAPLIQICIDGPPLSSGHTNNQLHVDRGVSILWPVNQTEGDTPVEGDAATCVAENQRVSAVSPLNATLVILTQMLGDIESCRISNENRLRSLPESFGPETQFVVDQVELAKQQEKMIVRELERSMKKHPYGKWVKRTKGLGFKTVGRLIGMLGDVYWNPRTEAPRTLGQLNAYCGLHVIDGAAAKRKKGVQSNWNTKIKSLLWTMSDSCMKTRGEFRPLYDERRELTAETHPDWTKGHSHNDALRIMSKAILRSIWLEARSHAIA